MSDSPVPSFTARAALRRLTRWLRHPLSTRWSARRELFDDLLRQASQIQTLDELLVQFPERLRECFDLDAWHLFLLGHDPLGRAEYRLRNLPAEGEAHAPYFAASSAVVARMKRERRPALVSTDPAAVAPEPWQLLATPKELALLYSLKTQLLFPLAGRTLLAGFASVSRKGARPFSRSELRFFRDLGPHLGRGLETALLLERLSQEAVERDRGRRELLLAREVQEHLLPTALPRIPGLELASFYRCAAEVGGDYYDAFTTVTGDLCLVIADVSGKGTAASLVMAALRASLHALLLRGTLSPAELTSHLNALFFASSSTNRFATLFLALYVPGTGTLEFCNAGHNPPALLSPDGSLEFLTEGDSVLGLFPDTAFTNHKRPFPAGSTLVLYTDGISEAPGPDGSEWSEDGLAAALRTSSATGADALLQNLQAAIAAFAKGTSAADDQTLLLLCRSCMVTDEH